MSEKIDLSLGKKNVLRESISSGHVLMTLRVSLYFHQVVRLQLMFVIDDHSAREVYAKDDFKSASCFISILIVCTKC